MEGAKEVVELFYDTKRKLNEIIQVEEYKVDPELKYVPTYSFNYKMEFTKVPEFDQYNYFLLMNKISTICAKTIRDTLLMELLRYFKYNLETSEVSLSSDILEILVNRYSRGEVKGMFHNLKVQIGITKFYIYDRAKSLVDRKSVEKFDLQDLLEYVGEIELNSNFKSFEELIQINRLEP